MFNMEQEKSDTVDVDFDINPTKKLQRKRLSLLINSWACLNICLYSYMVLFLDDKDVTLFLNQENRT